MGYFLPYQQRWIVYDSPLKIYEKSRRVGITYATSYRANRKCLREPQGSSFAGTLRIDQRQRRNADGSFAPVAYTGRESGYGCGRNLEVSQCHSKNQIR